MENETVRHKLWNPVPRKIQRTEESQTNLMTNVLCELIAKSCNKPAEDTGLTQGNILQYQIHLFIRLTSLIRSLARVFLQNPQLLTALSQQDSSPSNSNIESHYLV